MKKLKRITALILSVLMLMSMSVAVSATANTPTYTLVVKSSGSGYTYTAYQVFKGTYDSTDKLLKYIDWSDNINTTGIYAELATIEDADKGTYPFTDNGNVFDSAAAVASVLSTYSDDSAVVQEFAKVVAKYFVASPTVYKESTSATSGEYTYYTFSGLAAGYYLIKTTGLPTNADGSTGAYSRYILAMTTVEDGGTVSEPLEAKYDLPKVDMDLIETTDADAGIGDEITYYLTASLPSVYGDYTTYKLVFNDTLYKGLTYETVEAVYVYNSSDSDTNVTNATAHTTSGDGVVQVASGYTVGSTSTNSEDNTEFTVTLEDTKSLLDDTGAIIDNDESTLIQVVFTATLNSDALVGGSTGNWNTVYLEYSNDVYSDSLGKTVTDKVITWTYELDVTKIDADTKDVITTGAEFVLYRLQDDNTTKEYVVVDNNKVKKWTTVEGDASSLTSGSDGKFSVIGLDIGTYYLVETKAPTGYNKMTDEITIEIEAAHTVYESGTWLTQDALELNGLTITMTFDGKTTDGEVNTTNGTVSVKIENNTGAALPSTGGIGTTIFYIVGGVLVVGAIILLITKKRMDGDDK
ncbi:MAG: isopeptide-forming domain-containing fimbrial protein [Oscillospiraceae bacterium]|nr:isopeptide-forming domain-containing fimbrial protein [Oscillospiraceae bacterium]